MDVRPNNRARTTRAQIQLINLGYAHALVGRRLGKDGLTMRYIRLWRWVMRSRGNSQAAIEKQLDLLGRGKSVWKKWSQSVMSRAVLLRAAPILTFSCVLNGESENFSLCNIQTICLHHCAPNENDLWRWTGKIGSGFTQCKELGQFSNKR